MLPKEWLKEMKYLINPTGRFVIGGPQGDCGLTGRKIIVDTYGGACPHGGGAFSGKDPTKVDRSAAYARATSRRTSSPPAWPAMRGPVGLCDRRRPAENISVYTEAPAVSDDERSKLVRAIRPDARRHHQPPEAQRPIYRETAAHGHFGRSGPGFTWEKTDKSASLKAAAGL